MQQPIPQQQFAQPVYAVQPQPKKKNGCVIAAVCISLVFFFGMVFLGRQAGKENGKIVVESNTAESSEKTAAESSSKAISDSSSDLSYEITDTNFIYYVNSIGSTEYYGYVEILNTGNTNIYLKDCTFDLEDNNGHLLQSDSFISSCPDIIAPGEKGYFYNGLGATVIDESVSLENGIKLVPQYSLEKATREFTDYDVSDTDMRTDDFGNVKITGRISNNTGEDVNMIYVQFLYYDANGKVIAISGTNVLDLTAGSTKSFEGSTMFANEQATPDTVVNYKIIARKNYYQ